MNHHYNYACYFGELMSYFMTIRLYDFILYAKNSMEGALELFRHTEKYSKRPPKCLTKKYFSFECYGFGICELRTMGIFKLI